MSNQSHVSILWGHGYLASTVVHLIHFALQTTLILDDIESPSRSINPDVTLYTNRGVVIQPARHKKAANRPAPDKHGNGKGDEQGGHEHHESNANPEQRKQDSGAKSKRHSREGEDEEEQQREERKDDLRDDERL